MKIFECDSRKNVRRKRMCTLIASGLIAIVFSGCKKLVQATPPYTSLNAGNVFANDNTAISVLTGIYVNMTNSPTSLGGIGSICFYDGLAADEFTLYNSPTISASSILYYTNALNAQQQGGNITSAYWNVAYPQIYVCNAALEGLSASQTLTAAVKQQLIGEAKFMRAFLYFYLVNEYGDVPLALTSDPTVNNSLPRASKTLVWQQIVRDLVDAQNLLTANFPDGTLLSTSPDRVRPTKWAATAMLARVYLYTQQWVDADQQASTLINNPSLFSLSSLDNAFLRASVGNHEAIWQLQPTQASYNTQDAQTFIIPTTGPGNNQPAYLTQNLLSAFENGDLRRYQMHWIDSVMVGAPAVTYYFPFKYKINKPNQQVTEYETVLRLGEQYLIRAEAEAYEGKTSNAVFDLNAIRIRAGLSSYSGATDQSTLLTAILHERQVELFSEWGHRWLDLKRTGAVDVVMGLVTPEKGGKWVTTDQLFPVPLTELQYNPNLVQNPGY